jgi:hypothetical protein
MKKTKPSLKRLRKAKPSRRILKQSISDLEHRITMQLGSFLILIEEGTPTQISNAKQRAISDLIKIGPDMEKLAQEMGGKLPVFVHEFLDSVDNILHSPAGFVDEAKIARCFSSTQMLEKAVED